MIITPYSWSLDEKDKEKYDFYDKDPESTLWINFYYFDTRDRTHFESPSSVQARLRTNILTDPTDHPTEKIVFKYNFSVLGITRLDDATYTAEIRQNAKFPTLEASLNLKYLERFYGPKTRSILDKLFAE